MPSVIASVAIRQASHENSRLHAAVDVAAAERIRQHDARRPQEQDRQIEHRRQGQPAACARFHFAASLPWAVSSSGGKRCIAVGRPLDAHRLARPPHRSPAADRSISSCRPPVRTPKRRRIAEEQPADDRAPADDPRSLGRADPHVLGPHADLHRPAGDRRLPDERHAAAADLPMTGRPPSETISPASQLILPRNDATNAVCGRR